MACFIDMVNRSSSRRWIIYLDIKIIALYFQKRKQNDWRLNLPLLVAHSHLVTCSTQIPVMGERWYIHIYIHAPQAKVQLSLKFLWVYHIQLDYILANKRYVLASRTICRTDATAPIAASIEEITAMLVFTQNTALLLDGLKATL